MFIAGFVLLVVWVATCIGVTWAFGWPGFWAVAVLNLVAWYAAEEAGGIPTKTPPGQLLEPDEPAIGLAELSEVERRLPAANGATAPRR